MIYRILLVDDEPDILEIVGYNLKKEGYEITTANDGVQAIEKAIKHKPHLIIMDVMMPNMDGIEACEKIREIPELSKTIITFLTARAEDYSQIAGLEAGADDYITKPVKPKILLSKVKALLRRLDDNTSTKNKVLRGIEIDTEKYKVVKEGVEVRLARKEFELLQLLFSAVGKVFTREQIMNTVWGTDVFIGDRTIDVHIRKLREKLGDEFIETIKGVGYRLSE
ncbi:MAG: response regulator transcription factor [Flavobacteriales bacterium]|jgi:two-component system alkaline phosphatase synthesis response regulator PhoP|nr:response regulator transcription factor [Flavobacteriales bacterium]